MCSIRRNRCLTGALLVAPMSLAVIISVLVTPGVGLSGALEVQTIASQSRPLDCQRVYISQEIVTSIRNFMLCRSLGYSWSERAGEVLNIFDRDSTAECDLSILECFLMLKNQMVFAVEPTGIKCQQPHATKTQGIW